MVTDDSRPRPINTIVYINTISAPLMKSYFPGCCRKGTGKVLDIRTGSRVEGAQEDATTSDPVRSSSTLMF